MTSPVPPAAGGPQIVRGRAPVDVDNHLLSIVDSDLTVSLQDTPVGQRAAVTVRTVDCTLTAFLAKDALESWIGVLQGAKAGMTGLILG
jgi:hypothetical protein